MLDIRVTIEGHKVVIDGLQKLGTQVNKSVRRGLERIGKGVFEGAAYWLRGPSRSRVRLFTKRTHEDKKDYYQTGEHAGKRKRTSSRGRTESLEAAPGSYPVPRVTGHLLQRLAWLKPGETQSVGGRTFFAFLNETVIYNSADYAATIFEGMQYNRHTKTWSKQEWGPRDALKDGFERFNRGDKAKEVLEEEILKDIKTGGF